MTQKEAKENGGLIHQKTVKTAVNYGCDSLILTKARMRPLLKPQCDLIFATKKWSAGQHSKLDNEMSKLIFDAIGKYVHSTRKIIESQSRRAYQQGTHNFVSRSKSMALQCQIAVSKEERGGGGVALKTQEWHISG